MTPGRRNGNSVTNPPRGGHSSRRQSASTPHNSPLHRQSGKSDVDLLRESINELRDEIMELKGENVLLKQALNVQTDKINHLEQDLDDLQQYGRRENVCFSNVKFSDTLPVMDQVIDLCEQINVTVTENDLVDVHPLPARNGRAKRIIARFKDRKLGQNVLAARKSSKNIPKTKKDTLAADPTRGFGIQPNITPKRSALLAQAKVAVDKARLNGTWVDIKTGAILIRIKQGDRPRVIRCTNDIVELVPDFKPTEFILCVNESDRFEVFDTSFNMSSRVH